MLLSEQAYQKIDRELAKFPADRKRSALIQSLMAAQEQNGGWLSKELITAVAEYLELPPAWAYEVASFYSMFTLEKCGRNKVAICTNIPKSCLRRIAPRRPSLKSCVRLAVTKWLRASGAQVLLA